MKRILALTLVAMMMPAFGYAGTRAAPEISDPAGDAVEVVGAAHTDLTQVWFTSVRDAGGAMSSLKVHFGTAQAPDSTAEAGFLLDWILDAGEDEHCWGSVTVWRTVEKEMGAYVTPGATLNYACHGDENSISIGPLTVSYFLESQSVGWNGSGSETVVTIPMSALRKGKSAGLYSEGARLEQLGAQSYAVVGVATLPVDFAGCAGIIRIGSDDACDANGYTIGS